MNEKAKEESAKTSDTAARLRKNGKPRMARGKFWGIVGVAAVVIVAAGAGMWSWHEQPGFCSTMCHIESDYVANWEQPQNQPGTDKYGQPVSNTNAMMAVLHRENDTTAKSQIVCVDCHVPNMVELAHDGMNFVTGNYYVPRDERSLSQMMSWDGKEGTQFCVNENCHSYLMGQDGMVDTARLEAVTRELEFNPHERYHENMTIECSACHKGHRASVLACTGCHEHADVTLPDGWLTYQEGQQAYQSGITG